MQNNFWTHHNPVRINSGPGILSRLPELVPHQGILLLVTTPGFTRRGMTEKVLQLLKNYQVIVHDQTTPNPNLDDLDRATLKFNPHEVTGLIALGGGSVLDTAKVLGATLSSSFVNPLDAILRQNRKNESIRPIPVIAIPTTSGTGAEVTPFATVWDGLNKKKHSLSGEHIFPTHALLDPELTVTQPRNETLYTGLDAISHALESLWNKNRTPVSESLALHALTLANQALPIILEYPNDLENRARMQQSSLLAGLAISQTRTAIAHAISYPVTIHYNVPHGLACSFTLPGLIKLYMPFLKNGFEKQIIQDTLETLSALGIDQEIALYLNNNNLLNHVYEMFQPDRAGNCSLELSRKDVADLLRGCSKII